MLRDMLNWLGLDASEISNLKLIFGILITLVVVSVTVYGGYLLSLMAIRISYEQRISAQKARTSSAQAMIDAQKKEGEARIHKAQMDARAAQEEQRLADIKDGPSREVRRMRDEITDLKKTVDERDRALGDKAKALDEMTAAKTDLEGKYQIQEQQIKQLMVDISGLKSEYRDIDVERDALLKRVKIAEEEAAQARAEAERREAALCDLGALTKAVGELSGRIDRRDGALAQSIASAPGAAPLDPATEDDEGGEAQQEQTNPGEDDEASTREPPTGGAMVAESHKK